jgi:hypothetical protein
VSAAGRAAADQKHLIAAIAGAAGLGLLRRFGVIYDLQLGAVTIPQEAWAAVVAFVVGRMMRSRVASHMATGAGSIAVYRMAMQSAGGSISGWDEGTA